MITNPYTEDDKKSIMESIKMLDDMIPIVQKAKNCGVECEDIQRRIDANRKRLNSFLTQFFPDESI